MLVLVSCNNLNNKSFKKSCSEYRNTTPFFTTEKRGLVGSVKTVTEHKVIVESSGNRIESFRKNYYSKEGFFDSVYIRETITSPYVPNFILNYKYNKQGRIVEVVEKMFSERELLGVAKKYITYKGDSLTKVKFYPFPFKESLDFNPTEVDTSNWIDYTYQLDSNGVDFIEGRKGKIGDEYAYRVVTANDRQGIKATYSSGRPSTDNFFVTLVSYNDSGFIHETCERHKSNSTTLELCSAKTRFVYTYDKQGNWITQKEYPVINDTIVSDSLLSSVDREITYY